MTSSDTLTYTICESKKKWGKNIWRNSVQKHPKFDEIHEYTQSRISKNYHQDKLKENQTMTHYNQNVERKDRENLKRSKREVIHHI